MSTAAGEKNFTPGPWRVVDKGERVFVECLDEHADWICETEGGRRGANAVLISEAPALYGELESLARWAELYMKYHGEKFYADSATQPTGLWPAICSARAVLARARGEQS